MYAYDNNYLVKNGHIEILGQITTAPPNNQPATTPQTGLYSYNQYPEPIGPPTPTAQAGLNLFGIKLTPMTILVISILLYLILKE